MIITVNREQLLTALRRTGAAINPSYSVTRGSVLFSAKAERGVDHIQMASTDGTLGVCLSLPGAIKIGGGGRAMLPHKALLVRVTELPEGSEVEINVDHKNFHTTLKTPASKRKFTMSGHDPADYPEVLTHFTSCTTSFAIQAKHLISAAADVKQSIDPSRIPGALLVPDGKEKFQMVACATSFSVASGELVAEETIEMEGITIPSTLLEAASVFGGGKGDSIIRVQQTESAVRFFCDGCVIFCAKLYTPFPSWWVEIMKHLPTEPLFKCSAERFLESVRAVSVAADVEGVPERFVQIDIRYDQGNCLVCTKKSDKNYGEDELPVVEGASRTAVIHLDGQRLSLALRASAPGDVGVFFDEIQSQQTFSVRSDSFIGMFPTVRDVDPPAPK